MKKSVLVLTMAQAKAIKKAGDAVITLDLKDGFKVDVQHGKITGVYAKETSKPVLDPLSEKDPLRLTTAQAKELHTTGKVKVEKASKEYLITFDTQGNYKVVILSPYTEQTTLINPYATMESEAK